MRFELSLVYPGTLHYVHDKESVVKIYDYGILRANRFATYPLSNAYNDILLDIDMLSTFLDYNSRKTLLELFTSLVLL